LIAGVVLLAPPSARATGPSNYTFQPLAQIGGMAGDIPIPQGLFWFLGPLNDNGQLLVDASTLAGTKPDILLQYADGKFTLLVTGGIEGPLGLWPKNVGINWPISMNGRGNSVFQVEDLNGTLVGNFYRDAQSGIVTAVALPGTPATANLTFTWPAAAPAIHNRDEIALTGQVKGTGVPSGFGLFFRSPDGALQPIFVPGQALQDGTRASDGGWPSITDTGVVAFLVLRSADSNTGGGNLSAYQWEKGNLTPLVTVGMAARGGGKVAAVGGVMLNNQNPSALISARVAGTPGTGLYRLAGGPLTPVAVPGQAMPGGGNFKSIAGLNGSPMITLAVSAATEAGQHAFIATLDDNTTAVYRLEADGTLALVVKSGTTTPLGTITGFGPYSPPAMNSKGQVVASISFDRGPNTLVLLTPAGQ
jgi:hypothetical protein